MFFLFGVSLTLELFLQYYLLIVYQYIGVSACVMKNAMQI